MQPKLHNRVNEIVSTRIPLAALVISELACLAIVAAIVLQ